MTRTLLSIAMILFVSAGSGAQPDDEPVRLGKLSDAAWAKGDFSAAAVWYERAASLEPNAPEPLYNLALTYYRLKLFEMSQRYLDRAQPLAHDSLLGRCLLLRADLEFRNALTQNPTAQVEGLERSLGLYRIALAAGANSAIAKYDIEVVKLRLPVVRDRAPQVAGKDSEQDVSADEAASESAGPKAKDRGRERQEDRDW